MKEENKERTRRCTAEIYKRDTYRLHRGRGFEMHYTRSQCSFAAVEDGRCRRHPRDRFPRDCVYFEFKAKKN